MVLFEGVELFCAVILLAMGTAAHSFSGVWEAGGGGERGWEAGDEGCVRSEGGDVVEGCVCGGGMLLMKRGAK